MAGEQIIAGASKLVDQKNWKLAFSTKILKKIMSLFQTKSNERKNNNFRLQKPTQVSDSSQQWRKTEDKLRPNCGTRSGTSLDQSTFHFHFASIGFKSTFYLLD